MWKIWTKDCFSSSHLFCWLDAELKTVSQARAYFVDRCIIRMIYLMDVSLFQYHRSGIVKSLSLYLTITYSQPTNEQTVTWISWGISAMNKILSTSMTLKIWGTSVYGYLPLIMPYYVLCRSCCFLCLLIANEKN